MGRRKNNKSSDNNESSTKVSDSNPDRQQHNTITRFADAEEDDATASSILDDSVAAPVDGTAIEDEAMCDADVSMIDGEDDKTSADYYFDSYSHFGIYPFCILSLAETKWGFLNLLIDRYLDECKFYCSCFLQNSFWLSVLLFLFAGIHEVCTLNLDTKLFGFCYWNIISLTHLFRSNLDVVLFSYLT